MGDDAPHRDEGEEDAADESAPRRSRKRAKGGRTTFQRLKAWFRDTRLYLYCIFFALSLILFILGTLSAFAPTAFGSGLADWFRSIGNYNTYLFLAGFLCIITAAYLFLGLLGKRTEFMRLVSTKSKGDFVHSLDRIERLAFELGTDENEIVAARKREFKIRH